MIVTIPFNKFSFVTEIAKLLGYLVLVHAIKFKCQLYSSIKPDVQTI